MRDWRVRSHREWRALIEEQEGGQETIAAFCRRRGLTEQSFYRHRRRMREEMGEGGFAEVALSRGESLRVVVEGQRCWIEVEEGFDAQRLREVVEALR